MNACLLRTEAMRKVLQAQRFVRSRWSRSASATDPLARSTRPSPSQHRATCSWVCAISGLPSRSMDDWVASACSSDRAASSDGDCLQRSSAHRTATAELKNTSPRTSSACAISLAAAALAAAAGRSPRAAAMRAPSTWTRTLMTLTPGVALGCRLGPQRSASVPRP